MADVKTWNAATGKGGSAALDEKLLMPREARATNRGMHPVVLRDAVVMYEANHRVGTVQTKERHFVSGNTKKMYKQKHTGNARQGDGKAPHWTGRRNSPRTFGHFGRSGTFLWVDPAAGLACACVTNRDFGPWAAEAWPSLSDDVLTTFGGCRRTGPRGV